MKEFCVLIMEDGEPILGSFGTYRMDARKNLTNQVLDARELLRREHKIRPHATGFTLIRCSRLGYDESEYFREQTYRSEKTQKKKKHVRRK